MTRSIESFTILGYSDIFRHGHVFPTKRQEFVAQKQKPQVQWTQGLVKIDVRETKINVSSIGNDGERQRDRIFYAQLHESRE